MTTLLLTSVFRPFGVVDQYNNKGDDLLMDYLASRLTREPGLFSLSNYLPSSGLHLIAANLPAKTKVLDYPTLEEFSEEVKKGYDYLGITFVDKGFRKAFRMISLAREYSPGTKIVLGGFGTDIDDVDGMGADYVCRGEGVRFMRDLLGLPASEQMINPDITAEVTVKVLQDYDFLSKPKMGIVVSGFGCPAACEFCSTSAYFGHRHVPFLEDGDAIYQAMLNMNRNGGRNLNHFLIFEEDFMLYPDRVRGLGRRIQQDTENLFTFGCFASVRTLSEYDLEELVSMGLGHVWVGIESLNSPFKKSQGRDIRGLFQELHSLGVTTTGSSIIGLDHHTPENLKDEVDHVISLKPATDQLSLLMPSLKTRLRERLEQEGRLKKCTSNDTDLYSEMITHPRFEPGELSKAVFEGYERIYEALGPSIFRILQIWFTGYKNLRGSANHLLRRRAEFYAEKARGVVPVFLNTCEHLPNDDIRREVQETLEEIRSELGPPTPDQIRTGELIGKIFDLEATKRRCLPESPIEPVTWVTDYGEQANAGQRQVLDQETPPPAHPHVSFGRESRRTEAADGGDGVPQNDVPQNDVPQNDVPQRSAEEIQEWIVNHLAEALAISPDMIDVTAVFDALGLDSPTAVGMTGELEEWLGQRVDPTLIFDFPTIQKLSQCVAGSSQEQAEPVGLQRSKLHSKI